MYRLHISASISMHLAIYMAASLLGMPAIAQPTYRVIDLGTLATPSGPTLASALSGNGNVGISSGSADVGKGFLWNELTGMHELLAFDGLPVPMVDIVSVNTSGTAFGNIHSAATQATTPREGALWRPGSSIPERIPPLPGSTYCTNSGGDDEGFVIGSCGNLLPFIFDTNTNSHIALSAPEGSRPSAWKVNRIRSNKPIVGGVLQNPFDAIVLWNRDGSIYKTILNSKIYLPDGSLAYGTDAIDIAADGTILLGDHILPPPKTHYSARPLLFFTSPEDYTGTLIIGYAMNDSLEVVGDLRMKSRGMYWSPSTDGRYLDSLISPSDPYFGRILITAAFDINNNGVIAAEGNLPGEPSRALLLVPELSPVNSITAVDPYPDLLINNTLSSNTGLLSTKGRLVNGAAADGTSRALLRIRANYIGESLSVTLSNDNSRATFNELGSLSSRFNNPSTLTTITITAEDTPIGPVGFVQYQSPIDFAWSSKHTRQRTRAVNATVTFGDGKTLIKDLLVVRPPTILVHGIWDSATTWQNFIPLIGSAAFKVEPYNYKDTNAAKFLLNADLLSKYIGQYLDDFSKTPSEPVSASQVDIVAHSMGGNITRTMPRTSTFLSPKNYSKGWVHKLITIGTPHFGSPIATELLRPENACVTEWMNDLGSPTNLGAIDDLDGDGIGNSLSTALLNQAAMPAAHIGGRLQDDQVFGLTKRQRFLIKYGFCGRSENPPLVDKLTRDGFKLLLGEKHDGVVPLTSALRNGTGYIFGDGPKWGGIHSKATSFLGFVGSPLLRQWAVPVNRTIQLLNTPITEGTAFSR